MLEPRTLVKCVLCLANCAGFLHFGIDFVNRTTLAGTSACYQVVIKLQLTRSRYIETLKCCHSWFIRFLSVFVCFVFYFYLEWVGFCIFGFFFRRGWWILKKNHNFSQKVVILNTKGLFLGKFILENYAEVIFKKT